MSIDKTLRVKLSGTLRKTVEQKLTRKPSLEVAMTNIATILEDHESRLAVHLLIMSNSRLLFRGWPQFRGGDSRTLKELSATFSIPIPATFYHVSVFMASYNKKLSYRRGTARCVVSIEISPIAMQ